MRIVYGPQNRKRLGATKESPPTFRSGFTLPEVVMSMAIVALVFNGIVTGYIQAGRRAEWSGYSLAAHALAIQQLEQARSAKWDILDTPVIDEIVNLPTVNSAKLDLPVAGTNVVWATNYINVSTVTISSNPIVAVHMVQVSTVWPFKWGGRTVYFTNKVVNYFAPDR